MGHTTHIKEFSLRNPKESEVKSQGQGISRDGKRINYDRFE